MRISDWSSDVCSSDLDAIWCSCQPGCRSDRPSRSNRSVDNRSRWSRTRCRCSNRSEENTSELQSLMRISYAVFCLKKKTHNNNQTSNESTALTETQENRHQHD